MTEPFAISASINLDKVDFDRVDVHEVAVADTETVMSRIAFGWYGDLAITGTDPDRFERLGELCMDAARGLRIVQGVAEKVDELDSFPKGSAA